MQKVKLKCVALSKRARHFTVGKVYKNVTLTMAGDRVKSASIYNDGGIRNIGPCWFNKEKYLIAAGCGFRVILIAGE